MKQIKGISQEVLEFIIEVSKSCHPYEFAGVLQQNENNIISNILILPGTQSSETTASLSLFMVPNIPFIGTAHSHPNGILIPSYADIQLFGKVGSYHIIVGYPYNLSSWKCFDSAGIESKLNIIEKL